MLGLKNFWSPSCETTKGGHLTHKGAFMLKSIDSQFYEPRKVRTDSLLSLLKIYHRFYLSFEAHDRATFLVAEDDKRGVYGGAVLYPQKISSSLDISSEDTREERLEKLFSAFQPKMYWEL